jgi:hypothetical protein
MTNFQAHGAIGMKPELDTCGPHHRRPKPTRKVGVADGLLGYL